VPDTRQMRIFTLMAAMHKHTDWATAYRAALCPHSGPLRPVAPPASASIREGQLLSPRMATGQLARNTDVKLTL
jgi:hypothetical protein